MPGPLAAQLQKLQEQKALLLKQKQEALHKQQDMLQRSKSVLQPTKMEQAYSSQQLRELTNTSIQKSSFKRLAEGIDRGSLVPRAETQLFDQRLAVKNQMIMTKQVIDGRRVVKVIKKKRKQQLQDNFGNLLSRNQGAMANQTLPVSNSATHISMRHTMSRNTI